LFYFLCYILFLTYDYMKKKLKETNKVNDYNKFNDKENCQQNNYGLDNFLTKFSYFLIL